VSNHQRFAAQLYLINATLLITHEIDSAFWKEWTLFHLPGGIQLFLVLNLLLVLAVLYGLGQVLLRTRLARAFSLLLAGAGVFAFCAHTFFILQGRPQFTLPASLALLAAILVASIIQGVTALRAEP
jgi:Family of unknown function (DUF6713)